MYRLTEAARAALKRPLGELVERGREIDYIRSRLLDEGFVITVGDRTTENFITAGGKPRIEIVDLKEKRSERADTASAAERVCRVSNPPGTISDEAIECIRDAVRSRERVRIKVDGEEDLLGLPAIMYAPLGSYVLYGQPDEGLVVVRVDERIKRKAEELLLLMERY
ncbi:MAG: GTP-dependent dephospho-CoA kinase family protein [Nitrososphaeria archaeon]